MMGHCDCGDDCDCNDDYGIPKNYPIEPRKEKKTDEGTVAKKTKVAIGKIGCPHCGTVTAGALTSPICESCGHNFFEIDDLLKS